MKTIIISRHCKCLQGVYGVFTGEIGVQGFQIYENCMLPTIPVIFEINTLCGLLISTLNHDFFFKFPYNFCWNCRYTCNPHKFEIPALGFPRKDPVNPCKHLQCGSPATASVMYFTVKVTSINKVFIY